MGVMYEFWGEGYTNLRLYSCHTMRTGERGAAVVGDQGALYLGAIVKPSCLDTKPSVCERERCISGASSDSEWWLRKLVCWFDVGPHSSVSASRVHQSSRWLVRLAYLISHHSLIYL